uniref:Uncharacterized protein n=1 Tax=Anguilla anguilla TaxID=7936 RepID=A0A0E9QVP9_ANGAN
MCVSGVLLSVIDMIGLQKRVWRKKNKSNLSHFLCLGVG